MNLAEEKFPFVFTDNDISFSDYFKTNEDLKILFKKKLSSQKHISVLVSLNLSKSDFIDFYDYIIFQTDSTKLRFKSDLSVYGVYEEFICDIISNPIVSLKNNIYNISFNMYIINNRIDFA